MLLVVYHFGMVSGSQRSLNYLGCSLGYFEKNIATEEEFCWGLKCVLAVVCGLYYKDIQKI